MEGALMMVVHSVLIGLVLYLLMVYVLGQGSIVAETRSVLAAAVILAYMVVFGHGLPTAINSNL
jgi:hypothetical protein